MCLSEPADLVGQKWASGDQLEGKILVGVATLGAQVLLQAKTPACHESRACRRLSSVACIQNLQQSSAIGKQGPTCAQGL